MRMVGSLLTLATPTIAPPPKVWVPPAGFAPKPVLPGWLPAALPCWPVPDELLDPKLKVLANGLLPCCALPCAEFPAKPPGAFPATPVCCCCCCGAGGAPWSKPVVEVKVMLPGLGVEDCDVEKPVVPTEVTTLGCPNTPCP